MSTDARVTKDLMETLKDGEEGFASAAEKLADSDRRDLAAEFRALSQQRGQFYRELESLAASYGDDIDESGSVAGTLHRAWMSIKDALSGDDPNGILDAAEQGEDHAVSEYEDALDKDISPGLRTVVQRQYDEVKQAHDRVKQLRDTVA